MWSSKQNFPEVVPSLSPKQRSCQMMLTSHTTLTTVITPSMATFKRRLARCMGCWYKGSTFPVYFWNSSQALVLLSHWLTFIIIQASFLVYWDLFLQGCYTAHKFSLEFYTLCSTLYFITLSSYLVGKWHKEAFSRERISCSCLLEVTHTTVSSTHTMLPAAVNSATVVSVRN